MSRSQRTKGAGGEREVCALLSDAFGFAVKRRLGQARDEGHDVDLAPFCIEVKRRARLAGLYDWLAQCDGPRPVLMLRGDGKDWLVVMPLREFITLAREEVVSDKGK